VTTPRRRIIRPSPEPQTDPVEQRRILRLRSRLEKERVALDRWWKRLRRALNAVEKHQRSVKNLERQIAHPGGHANGQSH
jgi:hypothetical protein